MEISVVLVIKVNLNGKQWEDLHAASPQNILLKVQSPTPVENSEEN